ncbi:restriction endonuclease subunit S [Flavobacterium sandaracinum]|uniref:Restriction endonuclease subunit S n=1 Tax=Flavobacterium sandaracinum TaxID=2541733 RepID=A0A4R5CKH2_9FLAO|nr:restriction endonuclease subunit S [Flavobacterium sandaracinum]
MIEGLKLSKKILIKKIFNQQLSFDGRHNNNNNNFPDWEEKKIKELFSFKITNSFSREQLNHKNGKVKNIHYGDIHTRFQTLFDIEKEEVPYINPDVNINKINEENYCAIGDMIFADASEDLIDVGKSIEIVNLNNQKLLAGLHTILARPISNTFSIGFCGYLFKSDRIRTQIQKESQGSKVLSISAVRLSNISFSIPCIEEQIKITNFLSSIDSKIDIETRFLQKLEQQKKFLLQNLFV